MNPQRLRRIVLAAAYSSIAVFLGWRLLVGIRLHGARVQPPSAPLTLADGSRWALFTDGPQANRYVVLDFGASWCPPCRLEEPLISSFAHHHPEVRLRFVDEEESAGTALEFARSYGLSTPALDDGTLAARYEVQGFPTVLVLQRGGHVAAQFTGFDPGIELALLPYARR